jgi:hypothetical protein
MYEIKVKAVLVDLSQKLSCTESYKRQQKKARVEGRVGRRVEEGKPIEVMGEEEGGSTRLSFASLPLRGKEHELSDVQDQV